VATAVLLTAELVVFIPGFLGGITLYILSRELFFKIVDQYKWKKGLVAMLMIIVFCLLIAVPVYFSIQLLAPKISGIADQKDELIKGLQLIEIKIKAKTNISLFNEENAKSIAEKISMLIPQLINSTAVMLTNLLMMFFIYYYMLIGGKNLEAYLGKVIPLKKEDINLLADETKVLIRANALGIPLICLVQGFFGAIGYWMFGVEDWLLWGFFTGVFAFFPLVGTMIVWVPLVAYMYATGTEWLATGLTVYSIVVTGNVDYLARMTLMKKLGNVHPLITVLGVIVGLNLFGFVGLIFGPLLISYFLILVKIYINEFTNFNASVQE
jgi:predicted PurR-regulated permease PerM